MMRCIVIDDEQLVLEWLEDNIRQIPYLKLVQRCKNAMEAAEVLQQQSIDLIFLDIQMPRMDGLSFLRTLPHPPLTILVTAYDQYAVAAFDLDVVDYLMKPVRFDRFMQACNKAYERYRLQQGGTSAQPLDYFFVNVTYELVKVSIPEILYIEGMKDYVKIFLTNTPKPLMTRMSLKALEEKLLPHQFTRIHKSYLVPIRKIKAVKRDLISIGDTELPLSEKYKAALKEKLGL